MELLFEKKKKVASVSEQTGQKRPQKFQLFKKNTFLAPKGILMNHNLVI